MSAPDRVDAVAYHLERLYGQKVAQCPGCRSHRLWENYARACWHCDGCNRDVSDRRVLWVPKDERVRRPEEQPVEASRATESRSLPAAGVKEEQ